MYVVIIEIAKSNQLQSNETVAFSFSHAIEAAYCRIAIRWFVFRDIQMLEFHISWAHERIVYLCELYQDKTSHNKIEILWICSHFYYY